MGNKLYVGVDVAKVSLAGGIWVGQHGEAIGLVSNDETGFEQLAQQVEQAQQSYQAEQVHLIVEPTAGYELQLVQFAYQRGWWVSVVHPLTVRDWIKGLGQRAKTDRLDGRMLARYGAERQPRCWHPLPEMITALESLLSRKYDLEQMLRQERNRLEMAQVRPTTAVTVQVNLETMIASLESSLAEIEAAIEDLLNQHLELGEQA
jgi:transposase